MTTARTGAAPERSAWSLTVLLAQVVLPPLTAITLFSIWHLGAANWQMAIAVVATTGLHLGLGLVGRRPWTGYSTAALAMLALVVTPFPGWSPSIVPSALCFPLALWWFTATRPTRESIAALAIAVTGIGITEVVAWLRFPADLPPWTRPVEGILLLVVTGGGWALAFLARQRSLTRLAIQEDRLATAVAAERASIRRDLHDVIAHTVTVMVARTEAAAVTTTDPATRAELVDIAETGRDAHAGLRAMLATLEADPADPREAPMSLGSLPALVSAASSPLHVVTMAESGERQPLSLSAEVAVVRTVQEGVTNALRHLRPPLTVAVRLTWTAAEVAVEVSDDGGSGHRTSSPGHGTGLIGITERVRAAGGTLAVEQGDAETGWTLTARIPTKLGKSEDER